jgi:hypothetical protein
MSKTDADRPRGVLTPADREFLRGEREGTEGSRYNIRRRIRQRIADAILDFSLLFDGLPKRDVEQLIDPEDGNGDELRDALCDVNAFLWHATTTYEDENRGFRPGYENLVEVGIEKAIRESTDNEARVTLEVEEIEPPPAPEYLYERLDDGKYGDLTDRERQWLVMRLVKYGGLSGEDVRAMFEQSADAEMVARLRNDLEEADQS